jgi:hypothetical protein
MNRTWIAAAAGALTLAAAGSASAQTIIVDSGYGPPVYSVAPAPVIPAPVAVAPAEPVYVVPPADYAAPAIVAPPVSREVVVTAPVPAWTVAPGPVYAEW